MRLAPELVGACGRAVEAYDQEGEVGEEFEPCVTAVFQALTESSLSPADKLEWAVDMSLEDGYGLCETGLAQFWEKRYAKSAWSTLADRLQQRLEECEAPAGKEDYSVRYQRDHLSNWLIRALEQAGREDEVIPLCEREAQITSRYDRLVDRLMAAKRWEEAERWCQQGIAATESDSPGLSTSLRHQLRTISEQTGDRLRAVAFRADEFFASPSQHTFEELCQAARKARVGKAVEEWARHYLETGRKPSSRKRQSDPDPAWPLPATGIPSPPSRQTPQAPMTNVLIQLAMAAKKPDEILKWYDHPHHKKNAGIFRSSLDLRVAEAVKTAHPDRAVNIWKKTAEAHIATVQVKGYEAAGTYLRQVKQALTRAGRKQEWETYLNSLRQQNQRRPRCVDVLDRLAGIQRRIIDS